MQSWHLGEVGGPLRILWAEAGQGGHCNEARHHFLVEEVEEWGPVVSVCWCI